MSKPQASAPAAHSAPMRRWRLSRPGRPMSGPSAWLSRAPWMVLAVSVGLLLVAAFWPLPTPPMVEAAAPPPIPGISEPHTPISERQRTLASLTAQNIFAADGRFWLAQPTDEVVGTDPPDGGPNSPVPTGPAPPVLTKSDPLPPEIKPAFENLKLVGVWTDAGGTPIAMITRVADLSATHERRAGEEFIDETFPQAPWRIVEVDAEHDRVVLERAGTRVSLALYSSEPIPVAIVPPVEPAIVVEGARPTPAVVRATEADIMRDLRAAGIDEKDIAALTEILRKDPEALARAQAEAGETDRPAGLGEVFKLMQQAEERKNNPGAKDPVPPPAPPPG